MMKLDRVEMKYPDGTKALHDISLTLEHGENVALIGANGAGKTSLMLSMVGVLAISGGTIMVDDITLCRDTLDQIRERVGLVMQNPDDQLFMPVIRDDVAFGPHNFGYSHEEIDRIVDRVLDDLRITHLKDRSPLKLSGGEKRMAAIATVLSMNPAVMLFDEPTAFLDPKARRNLIHVLSELTQTKLIATHDLSFAWETCSRVVLLQKGTVLADGPRELLRDAALMEACGVEALGTLG